MNKPLRCLIVEDSEDDALLVLRQLRGGGYDVTSERVETAEAMRAALDRQPWDIVIADYKMPHFSGLAALELLKASGKDVPFIIVSGTIGEDLAVAAMKAGAQDYIMKGNLPRLVPAVERELNEVVERRARKRAEMALQESEEKFRRLYESSQDAIMILEPPAWRFTAGNPAAMKMLGAKNEEEFISHRPWELSPDRQPDGRASAEKAKEMIETAMREGSHFFEWTHRRISGEEFPADVLLTRMKRGEAAMVQATVRDITERKQAEARIRELAEVIDQAPVAVLISDISNVVTYCNEGAVRLHGCKKEDLFGHTAESVFSPEGMEAIGRARSATWKTGSWEGAVPFLTCDGREIIAMYHMSLIRDEAGRPKARLTIATDISEIRRLEEESLRAQRLENLGMLAAGIAHDFNNALAPITMAGPLLRQDVLNPAGLHMLDIIEHCAARGAALVHQMLSFARGTTGGKQLTQMRHVLLDVVELSRSSFPKSIQVEAHLPNDLWPIMADPTQMHQVFLNLCVNARDAMPEGGIITVAAENHVLNDAQAEKIEGGRSGNFLAVDVRDTGTGIAPEVLEKMWAPFFTTKGKGTGLGLSTVRAIVSHHDGFLAVHTSIQKLHDHGTVFTIYLPAAAGESTIITAASDDPVPRGHGDLILLVDDEATILSIGTRILTDIGGYRVIAEGNGAEAIAAFMRRISDVRLLVTDLDMPIVGGLDLIDALRKIKPALPVVIMTGEASKSDERISTIRALLLAKPFEAQGLLKIVQRALSGTGSGSP